MDISEDLCRADFFDLGPMGLDPKFGDPTSHSLMPVTLIDSNDYLQPDGNNNLEGSSGPIKSFLDEMLLVDPMTGDVSGQDISPLGGHSLEVLGTLHWNPDGTPGAITAASGTTLDCEDNANSWFLNSNFNADGEVTTLTNLVDPLFVTYGDSRNVGTGDSCDSMMLMDHDGAVTTTIKIEPQESQVVSSDLISSTYNLSESPTTTNHTTVTDSVISQSAMSWIKRELDVGSNTGAAAATTSNLLCDESLLRTALQSGKTSHTTTKIVKLAVVASSVPVQGTTDMTELRTLLSFPPLTSPSSSTVDMNGNSQVNHGPLPAYYELKVIDPMFSGEEANIPNVEELIMTRIDPPFGGYQASVANNNNNNNNTINNNNNNSNDSLIKKKLGEVAERKINSTTLSTKWTYTTNANGQQAKAPRKRKKNNNNNNNNINNNNNADAKKGQNGDNPASPGSTKTVGSPAGSQGNAANGVRKERSLHYCNICCKGFKDKYSVNVHVRTHTGEKPFSCTLCGKNFRQKAHLAKHYQTHAAKAASEQLKAASSNSNANSNSNSNCSTSNNATVSSTNGSLDESSSTSCSNNSNVDTVDSSQR